MASAGADFPEWLKEFGDEKSELFRALLNLDWKFETFGTHVFAITPDYHNIGETTKDLLERGKEEGWFSRVEYPDYTHKARGEFAKALEFKRKLQSLDWQFHGDNETWRVLPLTAITSSKLFSEKDALTAGRMYGFLEDELCHFVPGVGKGPFVYASDEFAPTVRKSINARDSLFNIVGNYFAEDGGFATISPNFSEIHLVVPVNKLDSQEFLKKLAAVYGITTGDDEYGKPVARIPEELISNFRKFEKEQLNPLDFIKRELGAIVDESSEKVEANPESKKLVHREIKQPRTTSGVIDVPLDKRGIVLDQIMDTLHIRPRVTTSKIELMQETNADFTLTINPRLVDKEFLSQNRHLSAIRQLEVWGKAEGLTKA